MPNKPSGLKSFVERAKTGDSEVKVYYTMAMRPHTVSEETGELYLSQTTVEGEGEVGDEVENINGVKSAYIKAIR